MDVVIRPQRDTDQEGVGRIVSAAFARPVVVELAEALWERGGPAMVAEADGELVGHVQLTWCWLDAPTQLVDVLVLSPLSVGPARQRQGIGGQLVGAAITAAEQAGAPLLFLEGSPDYYSRFGFEAGGEHAFTAPSERIPPAAFQVVRLAGYEPTMTGPLVYAEAFWRFDCVGLR